MSEKLASLEFKMHLSQSYAASVGYFIAAFSGTEASMNRAIWTILERSDEDGGLEVTTAIRDFGQRMLLLAKLGKVCLQCEKQRNDCASIVRALQFLNDRRVDLVHGVWVAWMPDTEHTVMERATAERTKVRHAISEFSTGHLCELTEYALLTTDALRMFWANMRHGSNLALPSLDTQPQPPVRVRH